MPMPQYVLDTDTLSLYQRGHPRIGPAVDAWAPGTLGLAIITVEEQFVGWLTVARRTKRPDLLAIAYSGWTDSVHSLRRFQILNYTAPAIARYERLDRMKLRVRGNDLRIAAIALEHAATVVTRHTSDFARVPGLAAPDWSF